ncbi:helix-turn-helix domain-containing protein [Streptomyces qinglanensis]|uniref:helix-turn-helix domain-containing protein n=2 Tax=Streptomyces TaxID=1883 RepID=UPI003D7313EC
MFPPAPSRGWHRGQEQGTCCVTRTDRGTPSGSVTRSATIHVHTALGRARFIHPDSRFPKTRISSYNSHMAKRPLAIGPAGIRTAQLIERLRDERDLSQRALAARLAHLHRPLPHTALSRIERTRRRCDVDDLVAIAEALGVSPMALLQPISSGADRVIARPEAGRRNG